MRPSSSASPGCACEPEILRISHANMCSHRLAKQDIVNKYSLLVTVPVCFCAHRSFCFHERTVEQAISQFIEISVGGVGV
jgi:hypothetical protein